MKAQVMAFGQLAALSTAVVQKRRKQLERDVLDAVVAWANDHPNKPVASNNLLVAHFQLTDTMNEMERRDRERAAGTGPNATGEPTRERAPGGEAEPE